MLVNTLQHRLLVTQGAWFEPSSRYVSHPARYTRYKLMDEITNNVPLHSQSSLLGHCQNSLLAFGSSPAFRGVLDYWQALDYKEKTQSFDHVLVNPMNYVWSKPGMCAIDILSSKCLPKVHDGIHELFQVYVGPNFFQTPILSFSGGTYFFELVALLWQNLL